MRNWNPCRHSIHCNDLDCFYSTYEELKRHPSSPPKIFFSSFYSTYEELKQEY